MLGNYVKVAVRFLAAHRLYAALNICGLAVGLAAAMLIALYVRHEMSFDNWIPDSERIYRMHTQFDIPGRQSIFGVTAPGPAKAVLKKDYAEIEDVTRAFQSNPVIRYAGNSYYEDLVMTDPNFFDVLALPMVIGDRATALKEPETIALSESMARKYFGDEPAIGKTLTAELRYGTRDLRVTAVFKDLPENTHLKLGMVTPFNETALKDQPWVLESWTSINTMIYIKFRPGADVERVMRDLPEFERRNVPAEKMAGKEFNVADLMTLSLVKLPDVHLHSRGFGELKPQGDIVTVLTFSAVAILILVIACINFTNLATARASQRAREVALRKVMGAHRGQLLAQFLSESVLLASLAAGLAVALVMLLLPTYNTMLGTTLSVGSYGWMETVVALAAMVIVVGIGGGAYPAIYLSGFLPARILKANKSAANEGSGRLRSALVIVQFAISIGLIVCTAVVYAQTLYAKSMNPGFDKSGLLSISGLRSRPALPVGETLVNRLRQIPGVTDVTRADVTPADEDENNAVMQIPGLETAQPIVVGRTHVDFGFFKTMGVPILAGREFSREFGLDEVTGTPQEQVTRGGNVILNRRAVELLGFGTPEQALGRQLKLGVGDDKARDLMATVTVVGVVENINFTSARREFRPVFYRVITENMNYALVRARNVDPTALREQAEAIWKELVPSRPFSSTFAEEAMAAQYDGDAARGRMFATFSGLAVLIACLGLYGLASFTAEQRTKEIGIRKVLGARLGDVVGLLAWDFAKPVLIANLIAWPAAWWVMRDWLDGFQQRIDLSITPFAVSGLTALIVAMLTVSSHAVRVGRANAIHALRYE